MDFYSSGSADSNIRLCRVGPGYRWQMPLEKVQLANRNAHLGGPGSTRLKRGTHVEFLRCCLNEIPEMSVACEMQVLGSHSEDRFQVIVPSIEEWRKISEPNHNLDEVVIYTDGSKIEDGTRAAFIIQWQGESCEE